MKNIVVVQYDKNWPLAFEQIKNELVLVLQGSILDIEHVGSTSVPKLWAKPIIDIDIVIDKVRFDIVKTQLNKIGYTHVGDLGIEGKEAFQYENKSHLAEHHLYVCDKDAEELKRHITLRNFLNNIKNIEINIAK